MSNQSPIPFSIAAEKKLAKQVWNIDSSKASDETSLLALIVKENFHVFSDYILYKLIISSKVL